MSVADTRTPVTVITGASNGIGRAIAEAVLAQGRAVVNLDYVLPTWSHPLLTSYQGDLTDEAHAAKYGLKPRARVVGMATAGVAPRIMGFGPTPATQKVLAQTGLTLDHMDVIELNEAFAAQGLAVLRALGLKDDDARVNAWGGAIALGHPLGASGARLVTTAVNRLHEHAGQYALCTMCIGVGQGIALIIERV